VRSGEKGGVQKRRHSSLIGESGALSGHAHRKSSATFQKTRNMSFESSSSAEPYASLRRMMLGEYRSCVAALLIYNDDVSEWGREYCEQQRAHRQVSLINVPCT